MSVVSDCRHVRTVERGGRRQATPFHLPVHDNDTARDFRKEKNDNSVFHTMQATDKDPPDEKNSSGERQADFLRTTRGSDDSSEIHGDAERLCTGNANNRPGSTVHKVVLPQRGARQRDMENHEA